MKYENYEQIEKFVKLIESHNVLLTDLERARAVIIDSGYGHTLLRISEGNDFEPFASTLIEDIKKDLIQRIDNLKSMLEKL